MMKRTRTATIGMRRLLGARVFSLRRQICRLVSRPILVAGRWMLAPWALISGLWTLAWGAGSLDANYANATAFSVKRGNARSRDRRQDGDAYPRYRRVPAPRLRQASS
jgi:hypothetical protein